jgi:hypothetical protein
MLLRSHSIIMSEPARTGEVPKGSFRDNRIYRANSDCFCRLRRHRNDVGSEPCHVRGVFELFSLELNKTIQNHIVFADQLTRFPKTSLLFPETSLLFQNTSPQIGDISLLSPETSLLYPKYDLLFHNRGLLRQNVVMLTGKTEQLFHNTHLLLSETNQHILITSLYFPITSIITGNLVSFPKKHVCYFKKQVAISCMLTCSSENKSYYFQNMPAFLKDEQLWG